MSTEDIYQYKLNLIRNICVAKNINCDNLLELYKKQNKQQTSKVNIITPTGLLKQPEVIPEKNRKKRAPNKEYTDAERCCACVKPDIRCSRPRKNGLYCGSHTREGSIKYGVIKMV